MDISNIFNNYDFIKLDELRISPDTKIVILYARFMHNFDEGLTLDTHSHSFYEFHLPLTGSCSIVLQNSQKASLDTGKYLLIHPYTNHKFTSFSDGFLRLSIAFDIQRNNSVLSEEDKYIIGNSGKQISDISDQIFSEHSGRRLGYENIVNFLIQTILTHFLRKHPEILYGDRKQGDVSNSIISNAIAFIRNSIAFGITTDDVAKSVNLSSRQLNRIFTANFKMTVSKFITNERIFRVREHLKKTNLSLREIASLTGFNDEYVLCKTFRKVTGTTPGKYRAKHRKK